MQLTPAAHYLQTQAAKYLKMHEEKLKEAERIKEEYLAETRRPIAKPGPLSRWLLKEPVRHPMDRVTAIRLARTDQRRVDALSDAAIYCNQSTMYAQNARLELARTVYEKGLIV